MIRTFLGTVGAGETKEVFAIGDMQGLDDQITVKKLSVIADAAATGEINVQVSSGLTSVIVGEDVNATAGDKTQVVVEDIEISQHGLRDNLGVHRILIYSEDAAKFFMTLEPNNK